MTRTVDWADVARRTERDEFVASYPYYFLVGRRQMVRAARRSTGLFAQIRADTQPDADAADVLLRADRTEPLSLVVAVCKADGRTGPEPISVGRTEAADVVIADSLISRGHAFFRVSSLGVTLADGESANGTFVGNQRLEAGVSHPVEAGDVVRFSHLEFDFVDAATAWERLRATGG